MKNKTNNRVRLDYIPSGVFEVGKSGVQASMETVEDTSSPSSSKTAELGR